MQSGNGTLSLHSFRLSIDRAGVAGISCKKGESILCKMSIVWMSFSAKEKGKQMLYMLVSQRVRWT